MHRIHVVNPDHFSSCSWSRTSFSADRDREIGGSCEFSVIALWSLIKQVWASRMILVAGSSNLGGFLCEEAWWSRRFELRGWFSLREAQTLADYCVKAWSSKDYDYKSLRLARVRVDPWGAGSCAQETRENPNSFDDATLRKKWHTAGPSLMGLLQRKNRQHQGRIWEVDRAVVRISCRRCRRQQQFQLQLMQHAATTTPPPSPPPQQLQVRWQSFKTS
jgi:hypothetical protein